MKFNYLLTFALLVSALALSAQKDFQPGYVITNEGDTLKGEIDYRGDKVMASTCKFKSGSGELSVYSPYDIHSYRILGGKYYISREIDKNRYFLEYLINGKLNVYYLRVGNRDTYYMDKEGEPLSEILYEEGVKEMNGQKYGYQSTDHIGLLKVYMREAPELTSQIENYKKPDRDGLILLAEDYHNQVCKGEQCVIYAKKTSLFSLSLQPTAGMWYFAPKWGTDGFFRAAGCLAHIWLPSVSKNIYFRTGILLQETTTIEGDYLSNFRKIPVQLEYIYSVKRIMPKASYGITLYSANGVSVLVPSAMIGLDIALSNKVSGTLDYDLELEPSEFVLIIPKGFLLQGISLGLKVKL